MRSLVGAASLATLASADRAVLYVKHREGAPEQLKAELAERSDPKSPLFLSWLSKSEVQAILTPRRASLEFAQSVAARHGASLTELLGDKLVCKFTGGVPAAFSAEVEGAPQHFDGGAFALADTSSKVRARTPLTRTPLNLRGTNAAAVGPQACLASMNGVTPTCIRAAYGLDGPAASSSPGQAFIVNQPFLESDLAHFQSVFKLPSQPVAKIVGPNSGKVRVFYLPLHVVRILLTI